jgi:diguanylate cyclase (GGDEF)-like protein
MSMSLPPIAGRRYRFTIYTLLLMLIAGGAIASLMLERFASMRAMAHVFNFMALGTAAFMIYHVWSRFRSEDALSHLANHDPLTGLAHRRYFEQRLQSLPAESHTMVLGTIDRFSRVIGSFGHAFGDQMMKSMAQRIRDAAEAHGGQAFRLDGANIAVLYPMDQKAPAFRAALAALQEYMRSPFNCQNHEVYSTLSLGAATFPNDGRDPATLLRNADAALQTARRNGGDLLVPYSVDLNTEVDQRLDMESDLRHAIERGELELHYQPQQSLHDGSLSGFEALLRWRRRGEPVPPSVFIPLAEESGLIIALGDWVLDQACRQASEWSAHYGRQLTIAVNISPRQFTHPSFLPKIMDLLNTTHIDPSSIELEITEGVMMENTQQTISVLQRLRALGLKLSIDDFGTGYSSLTYLKRLPIHKLKIDQSFVRQLAPGTGDAAIVQAVIALGRNLGLSVIAEGVEDAGQRALLHQWGCDEIQGYFFGRPQPAREAARFLRDHPARTIEPELAAA